MTGPSTEVRLRRRPTGPPEPDDFEIVSVAVGTPADGQVLVKNRLLSVDPYMRRRMGDEPSYSPPYDLGQVMTGGAIGEVVASRADHLQVGDLVLHDRGWRTHAVIDGHRLKRLDVAAGVSPEHYLGVLGMPGLTAFVGLERIAEMKEGDTVFVSAAAGAVGSVVGQLARLNGASRVIGSVGSEEKAQHVVEDLGFDAAINYRRGDVVGQLAKAAPDGIDVYFDNVGGDHLEAALRVMNDHGRIAVCGWISAYDELDAAPVVRYIPSVLWKRIRMQGFIVSDHSSETAAFRAEVDPHVSSGAIRSRTTKVAGIDHAVEAFLALLAGSNTGKMLVTLDD